MRIAFVVVIVVATLTAYGPSAQQKAAEEKARMDSVIAATKALEKHKADLRSKAQELELNISELKEQLKEAIAALQGEEARMESVKSFHLLRTSSEKVRQIRSQSMVILNIEESIETTQKSINDLEDAKQSIEAELKQLK